jgi:hypothetical protein
MGRDAGAYKVMTKSGGMVTVTRETVTIPRRRNVQAEHVIRKSWLTPAITFAAQQIAVVYVAGRDRQYMTGRRAAGILATGGVALLAPSRVRGTLTISTTAGDVLEFRLGKRDAKHPEAVAAAFAVRGYNVR